MTATNHGLFGVVIAVTMQRYPAVAIAVAPFSHFLLDALPHFSPKVSPKSKQFFRILFADMTLAVASTLYIAWVWSDIALLVVVCAFLAASPDLMWMYYEYLKPTPRKKWGRLAKFHSRIQWSQTPPGFVVELIWFAILLPSLIIIGVNT